MHTLVVLTISTGMRRGEVLSLRWGQIDLAQGVIILEKQRTASGEDSRARPRTHASERAQQGTPN